MTAGHDSSGHVTGHRPIGDLESLAGAFHPHAIGVQDFDRYAMIIDVRGATDFERDHIPGAVRMDAPAVRGPMSSATVYRILSHTGRGLSKQAAILVYCGRGGRDGHAVAAVLQSAGRVVDVLPGGWANYRRWVLAGLELLPRLIMFRAIETTSMTASRQALTRLRGDGQQVLDLRLMASRSKREGRRPSQMWFDSLLVQAMRQVDPARPVWVAPKTSDLKGVRLPKTLVDAVRGAHGITVVSVFDPPPAGGEATP